MTYDFHSLCRSLLQAIDAGHPEAEESVLCRIRVAVRDADRELEVSSSTIESAPSAA